MENNGQPIQFSPGESGIDIQWKEAVEEKYAFKKRSFVAVLDSGFAKNHQEIRDKNAYKVSERDGVPGQDDDGNGYRDDIFGWDFFDNDPDPYDFDGHGTQIASIISGANDGVGMQGISPDTYVYPLRVAGKWDDGKTRPTTAAVVEALNYIYYEPAIRIVNLSLSLGEDQLLRDTIASFDKNNRVLLICAAGNKKTNNDNVTTLPSGDESTCVVSVASVNNRGKLSEFSNYGLNSVDIAAPGENIYAATIKAKVKSHYQIDAENWLQTFSWTQNGMSWVKATRYQENLFYQSPTLTSPFNQPYFAELTNILDPINLQGTILPTLKIRSSYFVSETSRAMILISEEPWGNTSMFTK